MENEILNEKGLDSLNREVLMSRIQGKCAKLAKLYGIETILWLAFIPILAFLLHYEKKADWICLALSIAAGLSSLVIMWWYGKLSKQDDSKQFLSQFITKAKWFRYTSECIGGFFLGYFLGYYLFGSINEKFGFAIYVTSIVVFILLAAIILYSFMSNKRMMKDEDIHSLRELEGM